MTENPIGVAMAVIEVLEELEIPYHVGGSFASSVHGSPRQTRDIDLVVDLRPIHIPMLAMRLADEFYVEPEMMRSALQRRSSFNLIHLGSAFKIDVFVLGREDFDRSEFRRHRPFTLPVEAERTVMVKSPEDTLLRKLQWYRQGGQVSERQWTDVLGIVRAQGDQLDREYLLEWAQRLDLEDLLDRALHP